MPTITENQLHASHLLYPKQEINTNEAKLNLNFEDDKKETKQQEAVNILNEEFEHPVYEILRTIFVSFIFFVVIMIIVTFIIIGYSATNGKKLEANLSNNQISSNDDIQLRNKERIYFLKSLKISLQKYYNKNFTFPNASTLEKELISNNFIEQIKSDPLNTAPFKYSYAVYDNLAGQKQSYIISGALEGQNQTITIYSIGSPTIYHRDFRETQQSNVKYIEEKFDKVPKVKVKT